MQIRSGRGLVDQLFTHCRLAEGVMGVCSSRILKCSYVEESCWFGKIGLASTIFSKWSSCAGFIVPGPTVGPGFTQFTANCEVVGSLLENGGMPPPAGVGCLEVFFTSEGKIKREMEMTWKHGGQYLLKLVGWPLRADWGRTWRIQTQGE